MAFVLLILQCQFIMYFPLLVIDVAVEKLDISIKLALVHVAEKGLS